MKTLLATVALAALIASPALAQTARTRTHVQQSQQQSDQSPAYESRATGEGRTTGTEHTCGYPEYQYDSEGTPKGPYCH